MTSTNLLYIGIDGLRIRDALTEGTVPALKTFVEHAAYTEMTMEVPTISGPGWSSLLTGASHQEHRVKDNFFLGHRLRDFSDVLSSGAAEDSAAFTFAATGWPPLADPQGPGPILQPRAADQRAGRHHLVIRDGETYGYRWADAEITAATSLMLREQTAAPILAFVYLGEIDEAGHLYGGTSGQYRQACARVDAHLAELLSRIAERVRTGSQTWHIAITTDHGHTDAGGHGGGSDLERRSFLAYARSGGHPRSTTEGADHHHHIRSTSGSAGILPGAPLTPLSIPDGLRPRDVPRLLLADLTP
ncbi:alkaline phosphatase family protein [Nesterenkonia alba]|uniref:alkaline phosphatase family protein n=1 Tax=Nesterenkonia alba TaxID=515814 RepID=UPI0003B6B064|nr:alkaline phosphatase family protein [Nesterenkonia alba]